MTRKYLDDLTYQIMGAAIEVHRQLGPGLLESVYHHCLKWEFALRNMNFGSEYVVPVHYKGCTVEAALRCDFLVEDAIVVELKAMEKILPIHQAQVITYMALLGKPKGILINFNCVNIFHEGQKTFVNELFAGLPD